MPYKPRNACRFIRSCEDDRCYSSDPVFGDRLKIHSSADKSELKDNKRAAQVILTDFPDANIKIRPHVNIHGVKNPEYEINGLIADRKGIKSENGITAAFVAAKKQGCSCVVIDLDMNMGSKKIKWGELSKRINWRILDFESSAIIECYIIRRGRCVLFNADNIINKSTREILKKLEP